MITAILKYIVLPSMLHGYSDPEKVAEVLKLIDALQGW